MSTTRRWSIIASRAAAIFAVAGAVGTASSPHPATEEEVQALIAAAGDSAAYDGADIVVVLDEADVYVQPSGLSTTQARQVIKILTRGGVKAQAVQRFEFDPATNRVAIESITVHHHDGGERPVPLSEIVTQPAVQRSIFWGNQQHVVSVPGLEAGDSIEIRTRRTGYNVAYLMDPAAGSAPASGAPSGETELIPPMPGHWYDVVQFQESQPIARKRYSVHMPADMPLQYEVYNGALRSSLWFDGDRHVYTFAADDIPALKREPHMAAASDCVPKVVLATVKDWPAKSRWFHEANKNQFEPDEAVRVAVARITAGLTGADDKIAACLRWVANNVRYCGTTRGPREGYTLHNSVETFRDRAGVCKDKAGMLVTMLRVLGHNAFPAMTMAGSRIEAIPADQFNHCVTVIREDDGAFRILDPTWVPLSREWWSSREARQGIVYGTPEGQPLTLTPYYEPSYNHYTCRSTGKIDEDGTLRTRLDLQMSGYPDTYFRRSVNKPQPQRRDALAAALGIAPNVRLEQCSFTDPQDYSQDAHASLQLSAADYAAGTGEVRLLRLPLMRHPLKDWLIPDLFYEVNAEQRTYGMRLRATRRVEYEESLELPPGWEVSQMPEAITLEAPAASLSFEPRLEPGRLSYCFTFTLKQHAVEPKDYAGLKQALDKMNEIAGRWIVCTTPAGRAIDQHAAR